jgi:hypothetical protein
MPKGDSQRSKQNIADRFDEPKRNERSNIGSCNKQDPTRFMLSGIYQSRSPKRLKAKHTRNTWFAAMAANSNEAKQLGNSRIKGMDEAG